MHLSDRCQSHSTKGHYGLNSFPRSEADHLLNQRDDDKSRFFMIPIVQLIDLEKSTSGSGKEADLF